MSARRHADKNHKASRRARQKVESRRFETYAWTTADVESAEVERHKKTSQKSITFENMFLNIKFK
jgi:hypothetical protein